MKNKPILLVNSNTFALRELTDMLKYFGFAEVHSMESANDAWSMLRFKEFLCIISAWEMPDMSGLALLRITRNDDNLYRVPFFLTDAAFTKLKVVQAGQSGVTGLLVTPIDTNNFKNKMTTICEISSAPPEPTVAEKDLEMGLKLIKKKKFSKALNVFENLVKSGESAEYYYNIGYIKTVQNKYAEAIEAFQKATQLDRLFAKAYKAMGRVYKEMGKEEEAQEFLRKAADIYLSKENDTDAEDVLKEILEINPETINVYNSLGVLYRRKGDPHTALKHYKKALKVHPDEPHILYNIGRLHLDLKDPEKAKTFFIQAIEIYPAFIEAQEVLNAIELGTI